MMEQKRLKDIVESAKPSSKTLPPACPKLPIPRLPLRLPDRIELAEKTDKKEKQNSDKADALKYHHVITKPNTKSPVWVHFGLPADENGCVISTNIAVCKLCSKTVSAKNGCTSNLSSHLKVHHHPEFRDFHKFM